MNSRLPDYSVHVLQHAAPVSPGVLDSGVSAERDSYAKDLLFASASVAAISGFSLPGLDGVPLFALFVATIALVSVRSLVRRESCVVLIPPLVIFMFIHLAFAFRVSSTNGFSFVLQAVIVGLFVWAFVTRYSQVSMNRYLFLTGILMGALLVYVISYHVVQGRYTSYKFLSDPKAVFDILPLMLVVLRRSSSNWSRRLLPVLLPIFIVIIFLSGERKAYVLLALAVPFLINLRSATTYLAPLALILLLPVLLALDHAGYVNRQIGTLLMLADGSVSDTLSDGERSFAIHFAEDLFRENPLIGVGTNGYGIAVNQMYRTSLGTHNEWMRVAAENGLLGLFFYAATILWGFIGLFRKQVGTRIRGTSERIIGFVLFATLVIYLSFEALDFIVLLAFCLTPMVQYLRLDPDYPLASSGRRFV